MKKSLFQLFIKRFLKYLILLILLIGMIIPLIQISKSHIRDVVIHNLTRDLQESTDMIEHDISKAQQMMNILSAEETFQKLMKNSGEIPLEQYVYLTQLQTKLAQLSVIFELDTMSYLVFRNTPVFISNDGCSDNYAELMPIPLDYADHGAEGWHDFLFESPYSHQFLPNMEFASPDFSQSGSGIIFIIDSVQNGLINDNCKLVALINCAQTVDRILNAYQGEDNFIYVADDSNQILYQHNYGCDSALPDAQNAGKAEIDGRHYQVFQASSGLWGLKMVCGMSDSVIEQQVQKTMISWLSLYIGIGLCVIIVVSLVFSIKETQSMRCLINTATRSAQAEYTRDEFTFLNHAFEKLGQSNLEKQEQIDLLSRQVEADILESLIMRGCYAVKEQPDFLKYFNGHFRFFCVTIFSFRTAGQSLTPMEQQQLYVMAEELLSKEALLPDYYHCFLVMSPTELVCVLSLNPDDSVNLNQLRNRLLQAMKRLNDQLEQEEWDVTICAGISRPAYDITNIRTAYLQAKNALSLEDQIHSGEIYPYAAPQTAALKSKRQISVLLRSAHPGGQGGDRRLLRRPGQKPAPQSLRRSGDHAAVLLPSRAGLQRLCPDPVERKRRNSKPHGFPRISPRLYAGANTKGLQLPLPLPLRYGGEKPEKLQRCEQPENPALYPRALFRPGTDRRSDRGRVPGVGKIPLRRREGSVRQDLRQIHRRAANGQGGISAAHHRTHQHSDLPAVRLWEREHLLSEFFKSSWDASRRVEGKNAGTIGE